MRDKVTLACTICKSRNYMTTRNKRTKKDKIVLRKYCPVCGKHTEHKEVK